MLELRDSQINQEPTKRLENARIRSIETRHFPRLFSTTILISPRPLTLQRGGRAVDLTKVAPCFHKLRASRVCVHSTFHLRRKHETGEVNRILSAAVVHSVRSYVTHKIPRARCVVAVECISLHSPWLSNIRRIVVAVARADS